LKKEEILRKLKTLIAEERTKDALGVLREYVDGVDNRMETEYLLQTSRWNRNANDFDRGILDRNIYTRICNQVNHALSQSFSRLPEEGNDVAFPESTSGKVAELLSESSSTSIEPQNILYWMANPKDTVNLNLPGEIRSVKDVLESGKFRERYKIHPEEAVEMGTITKSMQRINPSIVHFSGHGKGLQGIQISSDAAGKSSILPTNGLLRLFDIFKNELECIVLNICDSKYQAEPISKMNIYVVGMNSDINTNAARSFSIGFYSALAEGADYLKAFKLAMVHVAQFAADDSTPELWLDGEVIAD